MFVCVCARACAHICKGACGIQRRALDALKHKLQVVVIQPTWVLEIPGLCKGRKTLNHSAMSPIPPEASS